MKIKGITGVDYNFQWVKVPFYSFTKNLQNRKAVKWALSVSAGWQHQLMAILSPFLLCNTFDISPWDKWTPELNERVNCVLFSADSKHETNGKRPADKADSFITPHPLFSSVAPRWRCKGLALKMSCNKQPLR